MSRLVLVRHGQSAWNAKNLFTGWKDPDLTHEGCAEARAAGRALALTKIHFNRGFTSALQRARKTAALLLHELGQSDLPIRADPALNERDYGRLSGLNKDEARTKWGEAQVHIWRRSYDTPPPGGESLKDTAARVLPFYEAQILPCVKATQNILVVAHGNSLRALVMQLDELSPAQVVKLNIATGEPYIYDIGPDGKVTDKKILKI